MHDTIIQIFLVAVGLIMYPKESTRMPEWNNIITERMTEHLEEQGKLYQQITPSDFKMTQVDYEGSEVDLNPIQEELSESVVSKGPHVDSISLAELTINQEHNENAGHKFLNEYNLVSGFKESQCIMVKSQDGHEDKNISHENEKLKAVAADLSQPSEKIKSSGSFIQPSSPEQKQELNGQKACVLEQEVTLSRFTETPDNLQKTDVDKKSSLWYLWNIFSLISTIRFFRKYLKRPSLQRYAEGCTSDIVLMRSIASEVLIPDSNTLRLFHVKCIETSPNENCRMAGFLEGFTDDLLETMRSINKKSVGVKMEKLQMEDSNNIIVPLAPPKAYSFQCELWASDTPPEMEGCAKIKMVENVRRNGCPCDSNPDVLCLLHCQNEEDLDGTDDYRFLCMKNTPFLSKSKVTEWFHSSIQQAWAQISHKYEFELKFCNTRAPGALVVRFRSGKTVLLNLNPVVRVCQDAYVFIAPCSTRIPDISWNLSVGFYEDQFLRHLSKNLPLKSCHMQVLNIASFLLKKQVTLSGKSILTESHFKNALIHLIQAKKSAQWNADDITYRLRDLFVYMEKSIGQRLLQHGFIGSHLAQGDKELPVSLTKVKPVNLFHPLVVDRHLYNNSFMQFHELLKNTNLLIQDYVAK